MGGVELLALPMDEAFEGTCIDESNESRSLLANIGSVTNEQWQARPSGSRRTIEAIAVHVGACKVMYADMHSGTRA
ncbi:MAG: hypothetical protein H0W07_04105 [Chloroflexi bacterium]|nr:hypothetical protein [Chloroflexota bacterium]